MSALRAVSESVFDSSATIGNGVPVFSPSLSNRSSAMRFSRRFGLFDMEESNERARVSTLYKKKADKVRPVDWGFSDGSKPFGDGD